MANLSPLVTPVANLNGNSKEDLIEKLKGVMDALRSAVEAYAKASDVTHGRNFQHLIKGNDWNEHRRVTKDAQQAWHERMQALEAMREEIYELAIEINKQ